MATPAYTVQGTPFTNTTNQFMLVIGIDLTSAVEADGDTVLVLNAAAKAVDGMELEGTPAVLTQLSHHMLIPPGGQLTTAHFCFFSALMGDLEDLRGYL